MSGVKDLAWKVFNALQLMFTLTWSAACILLALIARVLTRSPRLPLIWAGRLWSPGLLTGAGARLEIRGRENTDWTRPCIVVANHQSVIDICVLFRAVPVPLRFVLKRELKRMPFVGWYARAMGMVFIDRAAGRGAAASLAQARELLREGAALVAFPEGSRGRTGEPGRFKPGVFQAAIAAGVPVVPVAIEGAGKVLPPGGFRVRPGCIRATIGEPIPTKGLELKDRAALAEQAREEVTKLLEGD